jgi:hypothetical protein
MELKRRPDEPARDCNAHRPGDGSWWEYDARGIELCRVCSKCRSVKLAQYRTEVLSDPNYIADEPIEED